MPKRITQEEFEKRVKDYTNDSVIVIGRYVNKTTPVLVECKTCHHQWTYVPQSITPCSTNIYHFKGCPNCLYEEVNCDECGTKFKKLKSRITEKNFCSIACGNRYKNRERFDFNNGSSYRRNAFIHNDHKCALCGWDKDERVLEVHHIDENREHNTMDNLIILCPTCHKYLTLHLYDLDELCQIKANE